MTATEYPRPLRGRERELLEFVLPAERPGYSEYRALIAGMSVIGQGRRGSGHIVLGSTGELPDRFSPLMPVIAYGALETTRDEYSITVRKHAGRQIDVEIVSRRGGEIPDHFEEKRRWTYSTWQPGLSSPAGGGPVREIRVDAKTVLGLAPAERRIWVWEEHGGMVRLIPITNFYNGLMQVRSIRDPEIALRPSLLYDRPGEYSDTDLRRAFVKYNAHHPKVVLDNPVVSAEPRSWRERINRCFRRTD
jgi:hypothetical protein